jgi:hypothetical protein
MYWLRRAVALALVAFIGVTALLVWRAPDAAPVRTPTGGGAHTAGSRYVGPANYVAWVPGGFENPRFRTEIEQVAALDRVVVVAGDTLWLEETTDAEGDVVDRPRSPYAFPIDAFAVDPGDYAPFVSGEARGEIVRALRAGKAVLGEQSARLRKLGPGGTLTFRNGSIAVGAVVPDDAVGWAEVLVSRPDGHRLGIRHERYLLAQSDDTITRDEFQDLLRPLVGDERIRVDPPRSTRYARVASGVRPAIVFKQAFGEFAAAPQAGSAYFTIQPVWVDRNIVTTEVPLLGTITCHRKLVPMIEAALQEVIASGLMNEIKVYSGCWSARTVARSPTAPPSYHAYGAAIDINAPQNPYGTRPTMSREIVRIFESWGFNWGGDFLIPDGHHFEFWRLPRELAN